MGVTLVITRSTSIRCYRFWCIRLCLPLIHRLVWILQRKASHEERHQDPNTACTAAINEIRVRHMVSSLVTAYFSGLKGKGMKSLLSWVRGFGAPFGGQMLFATASLRTSARCSSEE